MRFPPGIQSNRQVLGGTPVFAGTRVPFQTFLDYLEGGYSIDEFLAEFPTVKKEQVIQILESLKREMSGTHDEAAAR
ncbi:MAG: DUF433 domain-containing protein [Deltaproteobacteria bacterium]|nr:DUF433 domain-containing protein [Deltaproteobacteria bacterium]